MLRYRIAYGNTLYEIVDEVNRLMNDGWNPLGGVAIAVHFDTKVNSSIVFYAQAMTL